MDSVQDRVIDAWGEFVEDHIKQGWQPFILTFMFEPIAGSERSRMRQMGRYLEEAFKVFVTRVVRDPRKKAGKGMLPIWLCCPDLPVFKRDKRRKTSVQDAHVNDGLHFHAILLLPPWSRVEDVSAHFEQLRATYSRIAHLDRVDVEPLISRPYHVVGYVLKQVYKQRFEAGDIMPLPREVSELAA